MWYTNINKEKVYRLGFTLLKQLWALFKCMGSGTICGKHQRINQLVFWMSFNQEKTQIQSLIEVLIDVSLVIINSQAVWLSWQLKTYHSERVLTFENSRPQRDRDLPLIEKRRSCYLPIWFVVHYFWLHSSPFIIDGGAKFRARGVVIKKKNTAFECFNEEFHNKPTQTKLFQRYISRKIGGAIVLCPLAPPTPFMSSFCQRNAQFFW